MLNALQRFVENIVLAAFEEDRLNEGHYALCDLVGLNVYSVIRQK